MIEKAKDVKRLKKRMDIMKTKLERLKEENDPRIKELENALIKSTKLLGMYKLKDIENKKVIEGLEAKMEDLKNQESTHIDLETEVKILSSNTIWIKVRTPVNRIKS